MKKIRVFILPLIIAMSIFFAACNSVTASLTPDSISPWTDADTETSVFSIQKFATSVNSSGDTVDYEITDSKGESGVTYTLKNNYNGTPDISDKQSDVTTVEMVFDIYYGNGEKVPEHDRGKHDSIVSTAVFKTKTLSPIYSYKHVMLEDRPDTDNNSYEFAADFVSKTAALGMPDLKHSDSQKTLDIGSSDFYIDNEYIFYAIRSFDSLKADSDSSIPFKLSVLFDSFNNDKFSTYNMTLNLSKTPTNIYPQDTTELGIAGLLQDDDEKPFIPTISTSLSINATNRGPATLLQYSQNPFYIDGDGNVYMAETKQNDTDNIIKKALICFKNYEYVGKDTYRTDYTLKNYSVQKI